MDVGVRLFASLLMVVVGLGVGVFVSRKYKKSWSLFGIGAVTFVISQVFHIPFNVWVLSPLLDGVGELGDSVFRLGVASVFLGLSSGVFEEVFRYLVYRFWVRRSRSWSEALMLGAGHGGIEAILVGVLAALTFVNMIALRGVDLASQFSPGEVDLARMQIDAYWAASSFDVILGVIERVFAVCFHLAASVMVLQVFLRGSIRWLFVAIGWHALLNSVAVFVSQSYGAVAAEGLIGGMAVVSVWIVWSLRGNRVSEVEGGQSVQLLDLTRLPVEDSEDLEMSRYE
jgi:uncharacterized membrane protein YhfC